MQITLVSFRENGVNIFKELSAQLAKIISGLELDERFAPSIEDLPFVAMEAAKEADFVVVFALVEDENDVNFLRRKLVDVELASGTRILKAVSVGDFSETDEDDFAGKKRELAKELSQQIVDILFNERSFSPKDRSFE